jgi:hypothetical protein
MSVPQERIPEYIFRLSKVSVAAETEYEIPEVCPAWFNCSNGKNKNKNWNKEIESKP